MSAKRQLSLFQPIGLLPLIAVRLAQPRPIDRTCTSSPPADTVQTQSPSPPRALVRALVRVGQTSPIFVHFVRLINKLASISILKTNPGLKFCYHRDLTYRSCVSTMSGGFLSLVTYTLSRVQRSQAPTPGYNADDSQVLY